MTFFDNLPDPLQAKGVWEISGPPYCGKTLFMNFACMELTQFLKKDAYTTYKSDYSKTLNNLSDLNFIDYVEDAHTFVGLDDLIPWLDCRYSSRNTATTWIFNKYRKKGLFIMYSEQIIGACDYRLEGITDVFVRSIHVKFPKFIVAGFYPDSSIAFAPFVIDYGPEVYDSYKTLEIVQLKIKLSDLQDLYNRARSASVFKVFAHSRYSFTKEIGETIFSLLKRGEIELLKEYVENIGYQLI